MRRGKYRQIDSETPPVFEAQNFWDLLDLLKQEYKIEV